MGGYKSSQTYLEGYQIFKVLDAIFPAFLTQKERQLLITTWIYDKIEMATKMLDDFWKLSAVGENMLFIYGGTSFVSSNYNDHVAGHDT